MSYNRFLELLLRKKSGDLSTAERQELNGFLKKNPDYLELSGIVDQIYNTPLTEVKEVDASYLQEKWDSIRQKISGSSFENINIKSSGQSPKIKYFYLAAASIAAVLIIGVFYLLNHNSSLSRDVIVTTKAGSKTSMKLPDGSTVWLNGGSEISYNKDFGKSSRYVKLAGEAYFDVIHNANLPFIVHTNEFDIRVLGTAFNVKAYAADRESEATLVRGLIELSINNGSPRKIILKPHEKLILTNNPNNIGIKKEGKAKTIEKANEYILPEIKITGLQTPFKDSAIVETQWLNDCLAFRDDSLIEIAARVSRWYGVTVTISDESLKSKKFSGAFKDESVQQVMEALKIAGGFKYSINKNNITIYK